MKGLLWLVEYSKTTPAFLNGLDTHIIEAMQEVDDMWAALHWLYSRQMAKLPPGGMMLTFDDWVKQCAKQNRASE